MVGISAALSQPLTSMETRRTGYRINHQRPLIWSIYIKWSLRKSPKWKGSGSFQVGEWGGCQEGESESRSVTSNSLRPHWLYSPWTSLGQNIGVGRLSLLQGIFSTQGSNQDLPHCRHILCQLSHNGSPRILEWVAFPFSRGYSWPRNWTRVSCIAGRFFTNWALREALLCANTEANQAAPTGNGWEL